MKTLLVASIFASALLSGCSSISLNSPRSERIVKLTAVGYGSASSYERYTEGQKKLMAMRASKLDAYRSMAEQVYGVRITGNSTVAAMMIQSDNFRVYIDAYVRGARVSNITQMADGNYETTIEMDFDETVVRNFSFQSPIRTVTYPQVIGSRASVGPGSTYGANYYYSE